MRRNTIDPIRTSAIGERAPLIDHASASEAAARTPHAEGVTARNDRETIRSSPTIPDFSATAIGRPEQVAPQNSTAVPRRTWQTSGAHWGRTVYAVVAAILLIRLLFGLRSVLRLKRVADAIDSFAGGIPVLEADITIPLAIGFGKPVIVLPRGFAAAVTPNELHAVLAHEAEHLRRRDHWTILLERLIATVFWPVATVPLLNRALDRAREELCDNAVIRERDPASYAHTLLVVAQQVGVRNDSLTQWATSVLGQGELERRVAGLLDRRRDRRTQISSSVRWTTTATLLVLCGLAGTTRVVAVADEIQQSKSTPSEPAKVPAAPKVVLQWTGIPKVSLENPTLHRGIVLGPDGRPLPGASIYAASTIELLEISKADKVGVKDLGPVRAVTDAQGRFDFDAQDLSWVTPAGVRQRWETLLVAAREGVASGWIATYGDDRTFRSHWNPFPGKDVAIRTRPPATLAGAFSLEGGTSLANARVRLTTLFAPSEYDLDRHIPKEEKKEFGLFSGINYAESLERPWLLPGLNTEATTDNGGRFELPSLPEGFIAELEVAHPQAVTTTVTRGRATHRARLIGGRLADTRKRHLHFMGRASRSNWRKGSSYVERSLPTSWGEIPRLRAFRWRWQITIPRMECGAGASKRTRKVAFSSPASPKMWRVTNWRSPASSCCSLSQRSAANRSRHRCARSIGRCRAIPAETHRSCGQPDRSNCFLHRRAADARDHSPRHQNHIQ